MTSRSKENSSKFLRVVLHADDFGLNPAITDGILQGFRHGLLTSTSVLSNAPDADRALSLWKQLCEEFSAGAIPSQDVRRRLDDPAAPFDLGVHLNLTQGRPLTGAGYPLELLDREGRFPGIFSLFSRLRSCKAAVRKKVREELSRQVEFLLDRGLQPTHLNGHQYIEMLPAISAILPDLLDRYDIRTIRVAEEPFLFQTTLLKGFSAQTWALATIKRYFARRFHALVDRLGVGHPDYFHGTAHAGHVNMSLMRLFCEHEKDCRSTVKNIEIGLHPATKPMESSNNLIAAETLADGWHDPLAVHRPKELHLLTTPELAENLEIRQIRLGRLSKLAAA